MEKVNVTYEPSKVIAQVVGKTKISKDGKEYVLVHLIEKYANNTEGYRVKTIREVEWCPFTKVSIGTWVKMHWRDYLKGWYHSFDILGKEE